MTIMVSKLTEVILMEEEEAFSQASLIVLGAKSKTMQGMVYFRCLIVLFNYDM